MDSCPHASPSPPRTGARIETRRAGRARSAVAVAPSHGGADRNSRSPLVRNAAAVAPSHGGADRNKPVIRELVSQAVAPSHGGADRNHPNVPDAWIDRVAPSHGGADRNVSSCPVTGSIAGRPLARGRGSKPFCCSTIPKLTRSPPRTGARIETILQALRPYEKHVAPSHGGADRN